MDTPKSPSASSVASGGPDAEFLGRSGHGGGGSGFLSMFQSGEKSGGSGLDNSDFPKLSSPTPAAMDNGGYSRQSSSGSKQGGVRGDFPPLSSGSSGGGAGGSSQLLDTLRPQVVNGPGSQQQHQPPMPMGGTDTKRPTTAATSTTAPPMSDGIAQSTMLSSDHGLLNLLGTICMSDSERDALALGPDPTLLGLAVRTTAGDRQLLRGLFSASAEDIGGGTAPPVSAGGLSGGATRLDASGPTTHVGPSGGEPQYQLPMCYYMNPPALKTGHLNKFQLETLFYIFYAMPKDVLQAYAAQELYGREWRYHGELKLWFQRAAMTDGTVQANGGSVSSSQYIYFDVNTWERRLFSPPGGVVHNISNGFLPEEEIRVKFPSS